MHEIHCAVQSLLMTITHQLSAVHAPKPPSNATSSGHDGVAETPEWMALQAQVQTPGSTMAGGTTVKSSCVEVTNRVPGARATWRCRPSADTGWVSCSRTVWQLNQSAEDPSSWF